MNKEDTSIYKEYFNITKEYKLKYGEKTVLLMQVGSFFEIYGLRLPPIIHAPKGSGLNEEGHPVCARNDLENKTEIEAVSQICQFNVSEKKATYQNLPLLMAGFPDYRLDKYLQKITEGGYTVVVFIQEKNEKNTKRIFHSVHSIGTYVSYETDSSPQITNNIMCIWMENIKTILKPQPILTCGISVINNFTGKSNIFQYQTPYYKNPSTFDELERSVSMFSPSEVIIISPFDPKELDTIIQYSGIQSSVIHRVDIRDKTKEKIQNCMKQTYIKTILSLFYREDIHDICMEFNTHELATQSFCYLLDFMKEHNPNLVRKIDLPEFNNSSDRVLLLNHTIKQLNIIDDVANDSKSCGHLSSVLSFLNKCSCSMGKRLFKKELLNPTFSEEWLQKEYDMIEIMRSIPNDCLMNLRKSMGQMKDIEKINRQMVLHKLYPSSIYHLYMSIQKIIDIHQEIRFVPGLLEQLSPYLYGCSPEEPIEHLCSKIIEYIENNLRIDSCKGVHTTQNFDENIICPYVSEKLDEYIEKQETNETSFKELRELFNVLLNESERTNNIEYVKEHITEKSGKSLVITKRRGTTLKTLLQKKAGSPHPDIILGTNKIPTKDIKIISSTTSTDEISCDFIDKITKELLHSKEKINKEISIVYHSFILELENHWLHVLEILSKYVSKLDVLLCKTWISKEYNYCQPRMDKTSTKSYIEAKSLRHVLIEQINTSEIYVPNDCQLGKGETDGILLLGINMAGKSSYIKSIGVSLIMAQAGCYVPASDFIYKPYRSIFSRIVSNDNLFKNLSLFAVEMVELRTILKNSDENSLVLLDELSNGSETQSSVSILMTTLIYLSNIQASFICSTHFHEVLDFKELKELLKVKIKHLYVYYDRELDGLVYDRHLKEGSGPSSYGLEVCKSLYFPVEFIEKAIEIRNQYYPENKGVLSSPSSSYNVKKIKGVCEICHMELGEDIHHLQEQQDADEKGFIQHFHKNHPANLINICENCHKKEHKKELLKKDKQQNSTLPTGNDSNNLKKEKRKTSKGVILIDK
jgi:DNA mismatch repair protein MutS